MLRPAANADAQSVVELIMLAIGDDLTALYTGYSEANKAAPIFTNYYLQQGNRFSKELIVVDEKDGVITGMILCYDGKEAAERYAPIEQQRSLELNHPVTHPIEAEPDEYYIDAVAVHPSFQGLGIASQLMKQAELDALAAGIGKVGLLVDKDKAHAQQVYVKKGYVTVGEKDLNGTAFWHMVKRSL